MILRGHFCSPLAALGGGGSSAPTPTIYYPLESTADTGAGGLTLTNTGSVTFVAGKVNNCASFTGLNNLNRATNANFEPTGSGSWWTCFWLNWTSSYGNVLAKSAINTDGWRASVINSKGADYLAAYFYGNTAPTVQATISASTWTHFVLAVDRTANLLRIYKNGAQVTTASMAGYTHTTNSSNFQIGSTNTVKLDEVGIFAGSVPSQANIDYIYNSGTGRTYSGGAWA